MKPPAFSVPANIGKTTIRAVVALADALLCVLTFLTSGFILAGVVLSAVWSVAHDGKGRELLEECQ
jgi:hypothetical protein